VKTKDTINALREKTMAELDTDLKDKKSELFNLRFQLATGQLQNNASIRECKKDIARVKTVIRQRELAGKA
jgi:large subunit ribosomal protein L29